MSVPSEKPLKCSQRGGARSVFRNQEVPEGKAVGDAFNYSLPTSDPAVKELEGEIRVLPQLC